MLLDARPEPITIDPERAALLVIDMQNDFGTKGGMFDCAGIRGATAPLGRALRGVVHKRVHVFSVFAAPRSAICNRTLQQFKEGLACVLQFCFEARGAVAISAGPGLGAILVTAFAPVVRF